MIQFLTQPLISQYLIAVGFIATGILHFIKPGPFIHIMPDYIPWHKQLVLISGAAELLGGLAVLIQPLQYWAGWGLIVLLIAVFPANIDMTIKAFRYQGGQSVYFIMTLLRLPLQFLLIYWIYWACIQH